MERQFEIDLKLLKGRILSMGGLVEQSLSVALKSLLQRDAKALAQIHAAEKSINQLHLEIDESCMDSLVRLSPVAADLRLILAIIKINVDLERMGDQVVNIAYNCEDYLKHPPIDEPIELPKMGDEVKSMVKDSLDALMKQDPILAEQILERDDAVDKAKNQAFHILLGAMKTNPNCIDPAMDLILITRNLERMGDHATNIAEDVIFAYTGDDVRHGSKSQGNKKI